jgi:hypothetical protein
MSESTKNKIFFTVFFLLLIASVSFTYYRIFIKENFLIINEVSCDPSIETECFVSEEVVCEDIEDNTTCSTEIYYFKKITKFAYNIPECTDEECEELICLENEEGCEYTYCTEEDEYEENGYKVSCIK